VDVGTGSGCIAITLAAEVPQVSVIGIDSSAEALRWAKINVCEHGFGQSVRLVRADLCRPLSRWFDLLCANLPYVPSAELERSPRLAREPRLALDGGPDGLALVRRLIPMLTDILLPGGEALLEIEAGQGRACLALAEEHLPGWRRELVPDLAGRDRCLVLSRPG
jgi:release factor glutamine methyltransferase